MKSIPLTNGGIAIVDDEDFELVSKIKWYRNSNGYIQAVKGDGKGGVLYLHRLVMKATKDQRVDHRSHLKWDNRKIRLRLCTHSQNMMNQITQKRSKSSRYKGVCWNKRDKKWQAQIQIDSKTMYLGEYDTDVLAAIAYNQAALLYFGEFALLNEIV